MRSRALRSINPLAASSKIRMLNLSKKELGKDLEKAVEFDQSQTFKKIYESKEDGF